MQNTNEDYLERTKNGTAFDGGDVRIFAMSTLASALRMYRISNGGLRASRFHTPKNMLAKAKEYTGITYKRGEFERAENDLRADIERLMLLPKKPFDAEGL